jgi:hypothetical protein
MEWKQHLFNDHAQEMSTHTRHAYIAREDMYITDETGRNRRNKEVSAYIKWN